MSKSKPYPVEDIQALYDDAIGYSDELSDNALTFLSDIEDKIDYCEKEEIANIMLTDAQYSWLDNLANWDMNRGGNYD